jgi:hypothetical protein
MATCLALLAVQEIVTVFGGRLGGVGVGAVVELLPDWAERAGPVSSQAKRKKQTAALRKNLKLICWTLFSQADLSISTYRKDRSWDYSRNQVLKFKFSK